MMARGSAGPAGSFTPLHGRSDVRGQTSLGQVLADAGIRTVLCNVWTPA
jgi:hypothetical protein